MLLLKIYLLKCSHTCGSGHHNRSITCLSGENGYQVDDSFCNHLLREMTQKACNTEPCPEWAIGEDTPVGFLDFFALSLTHIYIQCFTFYFCY